VFFATTDLTVLNSNISCVLKDDNNTFKINNKNNEILMEVNKNSTIINTVKIQNTLFVDKIMNNNGNAIEIVNPNIVGLVLQSFNSEQSINVNNVLNQYYNTPTISINRFDNLVNIMEIGTCNIWIPEINKQFIIDRKGMVGIGSKQPEAPLYISQMIPDNPFFLKCQGENYSNIFNITTKGSVGIGTNIVNGLMHIYRDDEHLDELKRSDTILRIDMNYNPLSNISYNSNIVGILNKTNHAGILNFSANANLSDLLNSSNFYNEFFIMNKDMQANYDLLLYDTDMIQLMLKDNNIQYTHPTTNVMNIYNSINKIAYPKSMRALELSSGYSYYTRDSLEYFTSGVNITCNFIKSHMLSHDVLLMSKETYDYAGYVSDIENAKYNADKFKYVSLYYSNMNGYFSTIKRPAINTSSNFIGNIHYKINVLIEDSNHNIKYKLRNHEKLYEAPHFLYATSNNKFKASLSSYGTLSLGSPDISNLFYKHKQICTLCGWSWLY